MRKSKTECPSDYMEYPFGFGFELMSNPRAMERFFSMDDKQKRELMRAIAAIRTREEIRGFLAGITAELPPSERKTP